MKSNLEEGMVILNGSHKNLGEKHDIIKEETFGVEKNISKMSIAMSEKMSNLHNIADDVGKMVETSLDQRELLDKQSLALNGLQSIIKFQSQALDESMAIKAAVEAASMTDG
ncbi:hypothetical protein GQ457_01G012900 [Hibiscus cannabinus]